MSGVEIVFLVTSIVSAYGSIASHLRARRRKKKSRARQRQVALGKLRNAVQAAPSEIQQEYEHGLASMGPEFARGDEITRAQLTQVLIGLQQNIIAELQNQLQGRPRSENIDYSSLLNLSESSRLDSISALAQQCQRLRAAEPIAQDVASAHTPLLDEEIVPIRVSRPYSYTADDLSDSVTVTADRTPSTAADTCSQTPERAPSPELCSTPLPSRPPPPTDISSTSSRIKGVTRTRRGKRTTNSWDTALTKFARLFNASTVHGRTEISQGKFKRCRC